LEFGTGQVALNKLAVMDLGVFPKTGDQAATNKTDSTKNLFLTVPVVKGFVFVDGLFADDDWPLSVAVTAIGVCLATITSGTNDLWFDCTASFENRS